MNDIQQAFRNMITRDSRDFDPTEIRLSESGISPIYRLAKARGEYVELHTQEDLHRFWMGRVHEEKFLNELSRIHRRRFRRDVEIKGPHGITGHADAYETSARRIHEIKWTKNLDNTPKSFNIWQVQSYIKYHPRAEDAQITYLGSFNPVYYHILPNKDIQEEIGLVIDLIVKARDFPEMVDENYWSKNGIDLSKYYTPYKFAQWWALNRPWDSEILTTVNKEIYEKACTIATQYAMAKNRGDEKKKKQLGEILDRYYEQGFKVFHIGGGCELRLSARDYVKADLKGAQACGHTDAIPMEFISKKTSIIKNIKQRKEAAA